MYDLGDTVTLTAKSVDAAGQPANAGTVTTTVTQPDGTTAAPAGAYGGTGTYNASFVPTQPGRHSWRITFTNGVPDQAYGDVFHVWPSVLAWIVGLVETKDHLNIAQSDTSQDDELRRAIAGATAVVEDIVGIVARRSFTQIRSGNRRTKLLLSYRPVISVTSVVEDGATVSAADYSVTEHGVLTRKTGVWAPGVDNITVVSVAGRPVVSDNILDGTRDLIRVNFRPQIGGNRSPFDRVADRGGAEQQGGGQMRLGFFVPNSVMERLQGSARGPHVA